MWLSYSDLKWPSFIFTLRGGGKEFHSFPTQLVKKFCLISSLDGLGTTFIAEMAIPSTMEAADLVACWYYSAAKVKKSQILIKGFPILKSWQLKHD